MSKATTFKQQFDGLQTQVLEYIMSMVSSPVIMFNVPVIVGDVGYVHKIVTKDKIIYLIDDNDAAHSIEDFNDLASLIFISGILEKGEYVTNED